MSAQHLLSLRTLFLLAATIMLLVAIAGMNRIAQGAGMQVDPTEAPRMVLQANPTEAPDLPIRVDPSPTPTPRETGASGTFQVSPTQVPPPEGPGGFQANPTEPPRDVIDDVQALPTQAPTEEINDFQVVPPGPGMLTVRKWVCPPFYDPAAGDALMDCSETTDAFTFDLDNHDAGEADLQATTGEAINGAAYFEPPPGTYTLSEQIPDGYDQPFVWSCVDVNDPSVEFPSPWIGNSYNLEIASNQVIECDFMNVIDNDNHIVSVQKLACPDGVDPTDDYWAAIEECHTPIEGIAFSLTTESGTVDAVTDAGGGATWTNVDLGESGEIEIQESIPAGYGEPEVWCTSFPEAAADPFDYEFFQHEAEDGLITASPEQHEPYRFVCVFLNIADGPAPGAAGNIVRAEKRHCPLGVVEDANLSDYLTICTQVHDGVEFTLDSDSGGGTQETVNGEVEWTNVSLGAFEIQETLPDGYKDPIVFCGFTESPGGGVQHPALQDATGGVVSGSLDVEGSEFVCYWMNIPAEPKAGMEIDKGCPMIPAGAGVGDEITYEITVTNTGTVTLYDIDVIETRDGTYDAPFPTELAPGESVTRLFTSVITQEDVDNGNVNNAAAATASGDVNASTTDLIVEINIACELGNPFGGPGSFTDPARGTGPSDLVVRVWSCPAGIPEDAALEHFRAECDPAADGFELTLTNEEGASTQATSSGAVGWTDLPLGPFSIEGALPAQLGEPIVFCGWTAFHEGIVYDAFPQQVLSAGGLVEGEITVPNTHSFCDWMNVPSGPGDLSG